METNLNNLKEIWMPINGYEGIYEISNYGNIRSLDRRKRHSNIGFTSICKGQTLKPKTHANGYYEVSLCKNGKSKFKLIHRLVAQSFIENPENKPQVNHKNGNKKDNHINNLEWVTQKGNAEHAVKIGLYGNGERMYNHILSEKDVLEIRKLYPENTLSQLSNSYKVSITTIHYIVTRRAWKHVA